MRKLLFGCLILVVTAFPAFSIQLVAWVDLDTHLERSKHIVFARCTAVEHFDGFSVGSPRAISHATVLKNLKGDPLPAEITVLTHEPLIADKIYLFFIYSDEKSLTFNVSGPLAAIPIDSTEAPLSADTDLKSFVLAIFGERLHDIQEHQEEIDREKAFLDQVVKYSSPITVPDKNMALLGRSEKEGVAMSVYSNTRTTGGSMGDVVIRCDVFNINRDKLEFKHFTEAGAFWVKLLTPRGKEVSRTAKSLISFQAHNSENDKEKGFLKAGERFRFQFRLAEYFDLREIPAGLTDCKLVVNWESFTVPGNSPVKESRNLEVQATF